MKHSDEPIFRVIFHNQGQVFEMYARQVYQSDLWGFLEVEEFTSLVCWLSSEENTFSTAAVFDISGGRSTY